LPGCWKGQIKVVTREQLEAVAAQCREILPMRPSRSTEGKPFDVPAFLAQHGIKAESAPWNDGQKFILAQCPLNPEHTRTAFVIQHANGGLSAGCLHKSCRTKLDWHKFRAIYEPQPDAPALSEDAIAMAFTQAFGDDLKYTASMGTWFCWTGTHYQIDEKLHTFTEARRTCREIANAATAQLDKARRLASSATVSSVERLARFDPRHAVAADQWDADPWLLNTPAGTVALRTGTIRPHQRTDCITKITSVSPGGPCPLWSRFLARVTREDLALMNYLQRMVGYCLTGSTREHALFFFYGTGANGKSVFLNTITSLLPAYTRTAPIEMLLASRNAADRHPCDMAGLRGARLVTAVEVEKGHRWAEAKLKALTGGDKITARYMRQDFFEFTPQFKLLLVGNHRPGLRSVDEAIRRRFNLVPFTVTIPQAERDPELCEKLKTELGGILAWAIEGCLAWQREGLNPPAIVRDATTEYFGEEDTLGRWIKERCILGPLEEASSTSLFLNWKDWAETSAGEFVGSQKAFGQGLTAREGITNARTSSARKYRGIRLRTPDDPQPEDQPDDSTPAVSTNGSAIGASSVMPIAPDPNNADEVLIV
jgi:putative DNA primase/helicase